jgi:CheY-like chemotaxis protein
MGQRIFVNVIGFSDVERHALNTVFRLSEERETAYAPWTSSSPEPARMLLIDGDDREARLELNWPGNAGLKLVWVGADAPAHAWRSFQRPLSWPEVVRSMDELFAPPVVLDVDLEAEPPLDIDLDAAGGPDTQPSQLDAESGKRALIAAASNEDRLYLRARLALAGISQVDEAMAAVQVLELIETNRYDLVLLDFALPGMPGWTLLKGLRQAPVRIPHIVILKPHPSLNDRLRALLTGARLLAKPPHPGRLQTALSKV